jgi:hypothetical protein
MNHDPVDVIETFSSSYRIIKMLNGNEDYIRHLLGSNEIDGVMINIGSGWKGTIDSALPLFPYLRAIEFPYIEELYVDQKSLNLLSEIKYLRLNNPKIKYAIDFPGLKDLQIDLSTNSVINKNNNIIDLIAVNVNDLKQIPESAKLKSLGVSCGRISELSELEKFPLLESFGISYAPRLRSLRGIDKLKNIKSLTIRNIKNANDIGEIVLQCRDLKSLFISDCGMPLESLGFLKHLKLNELRIWGTKVKEITDVDLMILKEIPVFYLKSGKIKISQGNFFDSK